MDDNIMSLPLVGEGFLSEEGLSIDNFVQRKSSAPFMGGSILDSMPEDLPLLSRAL